jgi:hypothetical protein
MYAIAPSSQSTFLHPSHATVAFTGGRVLHAGHRHLYAADVCLISVWPAFHHVHGRVLIKEVHVNRRELPFRAEPYRRI